VDEVVVVGVPDEKLGQRIAAWVQLHPDASTDADALTGFVASRIAAYKVPEWLWIEPGLPTTELAGDPPVGQRDAAPGRITAETGV
jgi:acyl-CoA synthetase (AMP-forming)/AMP-acid ligase II